MTGQSAAQKERAVGIWLLVVCAFVYAMILVGGATRLTDSGLSITEWNFVKQVWPPMTDQAWAEEFALYRQTPEYLDQNAGMTMADFQYIYWWEWGHRFLGKVIGVVFAAPFFLFWAMGRLRGRFWPVLGLFALGGAQGALGWWMVAGGLDRLDVPSYRLATHLGMAFLILAVASWLAMDALADAAPAGAAVAAPRRDGPPWALWGFVVLLFVQILAGALVAGIDAGRRYGDWPTIGGAWFPSGYFEHSPWWRNIFESHAATQFNHRTLGYVLAVLGAVLAWRSIRSGGVQRRWAMAVAALLGAQVVLGVITVMNAAPLGLSLAHQALAAVLWLASVGWLRAVVGRRYPNTAAESVGAEGQAQPA